MRAHASLLAFSLGERVTFQPNGHPVLFGFITKYNRKSVAAGTGKRYREAAIASMSLVSRATDR